MLEVWKFKFFKKVVIGAVNVHIQIFVHEGLNIQ